MSDFFKELPSLLPFSKNLFFQNRFKENARNIKEYKLIFMNNGVSQILPFMLRIENNIDKPVKWHLIKVNKVGEDTLYLDLTNDIDANLEAVLFSDGLVYCYYKGGDLINSEGTVYELDRCSFYYFYFEFSDGKSLFSELFYLENDFSLKNQINISFWDEQDVDMLRYRDFKQKITLDTFIHSTQVEYRNESEQDGYGNEQTTLNVMTIKHYIQILLPDFLNTAIYTLPFHENVYVDYFLLNKDLSRKDVRSGLIDRISIDNETDINGAYNVTNIVLETDTIIKKICNDSKEIEDPEVWKEKYNFIFTHQIDRLSGLNFNLQNLVDGEILQINWGDGTKNNEKDHSYNEYGDYKVMVKINNLNYLNFKGKQILSIEKIPDTLNQINCTGCLFTDSEIKNFLTLLIELNKVGSYTPKELNNSFFIKMSNYVYISRQKNPVILSNDTLDVCKQLLDFKWYIDYAFSLRNDIDTGTLSSRYSKPDNYNLLFAKKCDFFVQPIPSYVFEEGFGEIQIISFLTGENIDINMYNFYSFSRFNEETQEWEPFVIDLLRQNISDFITLKFGKKGSGGLFRLAQHKAPKEEQDFDTFYKDFYLDVISKKDAIHGVYSSDRQINASGSKSSNFVNFFPCFFANYSGLGKVRVFDPKIASLPENSNLSNEAEKYYFLELESSGNYKFTFLNYRLDLSGITSEIDNLVFYMAFKDSSINLQSPAFYPVDNKIIANKSFTVNNLTAGAKICPVLTGTWKDKNTEAKGFIKILADSRLLIEKL